MIVNIGHSHIERSMEMLEKFFNSTEYKDIVKFDYESTLDTLLQLIQTGVVRVAIDNDKVIGIVGGLVYPFYFNKNEVTAQEFFWWVEKEYRNSGIGKELFEEFEKAIAEKGATTLNMVALDINKDVGKIYEKKGYIASEHIYVRRL